jgi:uncharacterized membrane protein
MSGPEIGLAASVFLACAVEAVEALTIVLALGATRGWRWALGGAGAALLALSAIVAVAGRALTSLPLAPLRVVVGAVLLVFGLHWLRKAVLRAAHRKALHDEQQVYDAQLAAAQAAEARGRQGFDRYCFTLAFQGVFVEGVEIMVVVLSFSASRGHLVVAAASAGLAVAIVALAGVAVRAPLTRVPENALKLAVGVMLTSFGIFWGAEGAGLHWPAGDAALIAVVALVLGASLLSARLLRAGTAAGRLDLKPAPPAPLKPAPPAPLKPAPPAPLKPAPPAPLKPAPSARLSQAEES